MIVTFMTASSVLHVSRVLPNGDMVAAAMVAPDIISAVWLVSRAGKAWKMDPNLWRALQLNGSSLLFVGSY